MNILIVQLLPRQFAWLQTVYGGPHHLTFVDSGARMSGSQIARKAASADRVIALTKFMAHQQSNAIPRDKIIHAESANMERLLEIIDALPADQEPEKKKKTQPLLVVPKMTHEEIPMSETTTRKVGEFILTSAVPPPSSGRGVKRATAYPFADMKPGESFFIPATDADKPKLASRISAAYAFHRAQHEPRSHFTVSSKVEGGVRCWRLEDRDPPAKRASPAKKGAAAKAKGPNGKEPVRALRAVRA